MNSPSGFPQNFAIAENLLSQNEFDKLKVSEYFTELFKLGAGTNHKGYARERLFLSLSVGVVDPDGES